MINYLFSLLIPLTFLLFLLLITHKWLIRFLGASNTYSLWLIVPVGLVAYSFPIPWQQSGLPEVIDIKRYLVSPSLGNTQRAYVNWFFYIWLSVAVLMTLYLLRSYFTFNRGIASIAIVKVILPITLPKNLLVYQSATTYSPMLIGFVKQKLIIPKNFFELYSLEQQKFILEHEICHFKRNDMYWNLIAIICLTLFWFHPLAWLAYFRFRQDQELSCDQFVLARKPKESRVNYGKALLVAAQSTPPFALAQLSFTKYGDKQIMLERINNLKTSTKASKTILASTAFTIISLLSGLSYAGNQQINVETVDTKGIKPHPIMRVEPKYPLEAAQKNVEGSVVLKFDITATGSVENVEVVNAKPAYVFDSEAAAALKQWKYASVGHSVKNNLVQLDFVIDGSTISENLIERIKVSH